MYSFCFTNRYVETMGFRAYCLRTSLETKAKSTDLHIIGRNMAFELFPRTYKGKNRCVSGQKHALSNSSERARI